MTSLSAEEIYRRRFVAAHRLNALFADKESIASLCAAVYADILEDAILDVAVEAHREARTTRTLGVAPPTPPLPAASGPEPAATAGAGKATVDVFGQSHPPVATDQIVCAHCGRPLAAGRYAPHLEKCIGKGRAASRGAQRRAGSMQGFV